VAIEVKGLPDDKRARKHFADTARTTLMRMARKGQVRRVARAPFTRTGRYAVRVRTASARGHGEDNRDNHVDR